MPPLATPYTHAPAALQYGSVRTDHICVHVSRDILLSIFDIDMASYLAYFSLFVEKEWSVVCIFCVNKGEFSFCYWCGGFLIYHT